MAFVVVLLQELITGKGVIASIQDGDPFSVVAFGLTVVSIVGLTVFLAIKGNDNDEIGEFLKNHSFKGEVIYGQINVDDDESAKDKK